VKRLVGWLKGQSGEAKEGWWGRDYQESAGFEEIPAAAGEWER
jgi:hypothetical protein